MLTSSISPLTPYAALSIFPLVVNLPPNPIWLLWQIRTRGNPSSPMPAEISEQMARVGRYMLLFIDISVGGLVVLMMRRHSVGAADLGLRAARWGFYLSLGCALGLSGAGLQVLLLNLISRAGRGLKGHYTQQGSASFWIMRFTVGAFAEELWRAFCLFAFLQTGHRISFAVVLTAIAFAAGHNVRSIGGVLGVVTVGLGLALLFVNTGSLVAVFAAHLTANLGGLYNLRRGGSAERT